MGKHSYQVGDKVLHGEFGEGLVVDVRSRLFYDVLEVVFQAGVKKLTSIHPLLRPKPALVEVPALPKRKRKPKVDKTALCQSRLSYLRFDEGSLELLDELQGDMDTLDNYRLHIEGETLSADRGFESLLAADQLTGIDRLEYQRQACQHILRDMRGRALLADEVGLGKTIEAAMVLKEYILRQLVRRALILVPASLTIQWQEELKQKAGLDFHIVDRRNNWKEHPFLICSLDTAKTARNRKELLSVSFDMVIVDEAHRLRNHQTLAWRFVSALPSKYLLLLTATPVQNDLRELYNLVNLLRPGTLGTYRYFRHRFMVRGDKRHPKNTGDLSELLSKVMIRTTRAKTNLTFPKRHVKILPFSLTPEERRLYSEVTDFVRSRFNDKDRQQFLKWQFVSMVLQKEIGSSTPAALHTLNRARKDIRYKSHWRDLNRLYELAASVENHAKLDGLQELLRSVDGKAIVFTQFRSTMDFLAAHLQQSGHATTVFHGGLPSAEKEASVARFRDAARILVSTEAGGEGRNLQFCRTVINYDLPWNPMKVEQRIGRVHRLGQTEDIHIFNFSAENTVESHVLNILHRKINMFHQVIGEMDMILGDYSSNTTTFESAVFQIWATAKHDREVEKKFIDLGEQLQLSKRRYEDVKRWDSEIFDG